MTTRPLLRRTLQAAFLALLTPLPALAAAPAGDLPFADIPVPDAFTRAEREGRIVVLFFDGNDAECKRMMAQTWQDEGVNSWLAEHAITLHVAGDDQRTQRQFKVTRAPVTLILRPDRHLLHRMQTFKGPTDFLIEASTALAGESADQEPSGENALNPMAWMGWGNWLFANDPSRAEKCMQAYLWCLDHGEEHVPGFRARHLEFLLERLVYLRRHVTSGTTELLSRRDTLRDRILAGIAEVHEVGELVQFNYWMRSELLSVEVFTGLMTTGDDEARATEASASSDEATAQEASPEQQRRDLLRRELLRLELNRIVAWRHYDHVLELVPDPVTLIGERLAAFKSANAEATPGSAAVSQRSKIVDDAVCYYECLLYAGRGKDAAALLDEVIESVPTGRAFHAFMERSNRLELYDLTRKTAERGMAMVGEKGKRMIQAQLTRIPDE